MLQASSNPSNPRLRTMGTCCSLFHGCWKWTFTHLSGRGNLPLIPLHCASRDEMQKFQITQPLDPCSLQPSTFRQHKHHTANFFSSGVRLFPSQPSPLQTICGGGEGSSLAPPGRGCALYCSLHATYHKRSHATVRIAHQHSD